MSENVENVTAEVTSAEPTTAFGSVLQAAREKAKLSFEDVSSRLRLSIKQIKALESNDFSSLPEAMITRGFIRNYARLLEIDPEPLLEFYRVQVPSGSPRAISLHSENILISGKDKSHWQPYIIASFILALLVAAWMAYFEYFDHPADANAPAVVHQENKNENSTEKTVESLPEVALPAAERQPDVQEELAMPAENTASSNTNSSAKLSKIKFSFTEATWVSVIDKDDKEIFNKNKAAGSEDEVEGVPPLKVVIGNAAGAKLSFNGKQIDLVPATKLNVAKLTLE